MFNFVYRIILIPDTHTSSTKTILTGIKYSHKDCRSHFNKDVSCGRIYRVDKGKVITGFKTFDGGYVVRLLYRDVGYT